jgi:hypothetical protein
MTTYSHDLSHQELLALLAGDPDLLAHVTAGEGIRAATPFLYPGRMGPIILHLGLAPMPGLSSGPTEMAPLEATSEVPEAASPIPAAQAKQPEGPRVRISDGGDLVKCLAEQGMELEIDMILSRTVFHAVRQLDGAGISTGHVYLDSEVEAVAANIWRFLQLLAEVLGLRHSKYKDALTQLERRRDADANAIGWRPT